MFSKNPSTRNQAFRDLARGEDCTAMIPGVCNFNPETTVLAHSNLMADGKGMGYKSDDSSGIFCCSSCHSFLDQGKATKEEKAAVFEKAQIRMIHRLGDIASNPAGKPRNVAAARWALEILASAQAS